MTMGHDGIGDVVEVGPGVRGVAVGDRAIAKCILTCGYCKYCRGAREHLCIHHRVMGFFTLATEWGSEEEDVFRRYKDGMWAEYCRLPATNVERLEPTDDVDKFSLVSQIAVGYRALKRARFGAGETVIVIGSAKPEDTSNHRNGTSGKTVLTDAGSLRIEVPRDREGSFEPILIPKHERRFCVFRRT